MDTIFKKVDSNIQLDEEQRNVILRDEDYTLVIVGAGAERTTIVVTKEIENNIEMKKNIDIKRTCSLKTDNNKKRHIR